MGPIVIANAPTLAPVGVVIRSTVTAPPAPMWRGSTNWRLSSRPSSCGAHQVEHRVPPGRDTGAQGPVIDHDVRRA